MNKKLLHVVIIDEMIPRYDEGYQVREPAGNGDEVRELVKKKQRRMLLGGRRNGISAIPVRLPEVEMELYENIWKTNFINIAKR